MDFQFISSIYDIDASAWDTLWPNDYPFCRHAFFAALETSGSIGGNSGWLTSHLVGFNNGNLQFAMPLFIKNHSYGEYVFDWSWAEAYQRAGLNYYPKLINAIPFTPASGPRFACASDLELNRDTLSAEVMQQLHSRVTTLQGSGFHSLFLPPQQTAFFNGLSCREATQFHWFNRDYGTFDDFLQQMISRKRKMIRRERRKVAEQNVRIEIISGEHTTDADWDLFYALYHRTYLKRSARPGYLNKSFFTQLAATMPQQILLAKAIDVTHNTIAGAVYFRDSDTLYGRYWGCLNEIDGLHFETCYYAGIEYAIAHKLKKFDPGAQGEHKIQRGFEPIITRSYHQLIHPEFNRAIADFVAEEKLHNQMYLAQAQTLLPFHRG